MDYVLLTPDEAGALLSLGRDEIVSLILSGELGGLKVGGGWRIPLRSITDLLAVGMQPRTAQGLERVFNDPRAWGRVFGAHPEVTQQIEAGDFPTGTVGAHLKRALAQARLHRAAAQAGVAQADVPQADVDRDEDHAATRPGHGKAATG